MPFDPALHHPVMCLTQDDLPISHIHQAAELIAAGARWIQVRMKKASGPERLHTAGVIAALCRKAGALCIVNDDIDVAIAVDAHGVHLGKTDGSWAEARRILGPDKIIGGTINDEADARRALRTVALDYVGIGPWRFTTTKQNLAPVLGAEGIRRLVAQLDGIPAWAIGGIEADDLAAIRATGVKGIAVTSALYRSAPISGNFQRLQRAWEESTELA